MSDITINELYLLDKYFNKYNGIKNSLTSYSGLLILPVGFEPTTHGS